MRQFGFGIASIYQEEIKDVLRHYKSVTFPHVFKWS